MKRKKRAEALSLGGQEAVFINCPFDPSYERIFKAIVFTVIALDFEVRCALDQDSGTEERLGKIARVIGECRFGIHDISFMSLDRTTRLPRYNMAFELGLFLGLEYGGRSDKAKSCLILDKQKWRYRKSISDLSGRDIKAHRGQPRRAISIVRDWLATESDRPQLPGSSFVVARYESFRKKLPRLCLTMKRKAAELTFKDYCEMARHWLRLDG